MSYFENSDHINLSRGITPAIKYLLISNGVLFIFYYIFGSELNAWMNHWLALRPDSLNPQLHFWKLVTYLFLHADVWHLLFNMLALWMFGVEVEATLGTPRFLKFYFLSGISAGLVHVIFSSGSESFLVGASGAIYGVLVAFGILFSERVITLLVFLILPVQIKAKYLVAIVIGTSLLFFVFWGADSRISYLAHLGGAFFGWLYFRLPEYLAHATNFVKEKREIQLTVAQKEQDQSVQKIRDEIDLILDKINEVGYEHLSAEEKEILEKYSKLLYEREDVK
jgi:membrane associated rhomboid family serine protease